MGIVVLIHPGEKNVRLLVPENSGKSIFRPLGLSFSGKRPFRKKKKTLFRHPYMPHITRICLPCLLPQILTSHLVCVVLEVEVSVWEVMLAVLEVEVMELVELVVTVPEVCGPILTHQPFIYIYDYIYIYVIYMFRFFDTWKKVP